MKVRERKREREEERERGRERGGGRGREGEKTSLCPTTTAHGHGGLLHRQHSQADAAKVKDACNHLLAVSNQSTQSIAMPSQPQRQHKVAWTMY